MNSSTKTAVVGGGCFWCTEAMYHSVPGVLSVVSGYAGGTTPHPTYEQVCSGNTGHAEVVQITYDPSKISYEKIIDLFWKAHDPTTLNRQGADTGTQYRSIILYQTDEERQIAEKSKAAAQKDYKDPIVTEIKPLDTFWPAEKYHQDFYENNPSYPYSAAVIEPKLEKFRKATQDK
jgi:peptide-methionine (S)-S-oxide reductase